MDSLSRGLSSLLASDTEDSGSLRRELTETGRLRFGVGHKSTGGKMDWDAVNSDICVTPARFGEWVMLATTFDGSEVRHFCNGIPIGSGRIAAETEVSIWDADIGNTQASGHRYFRGDMDELLLLARVMSANEIRRIYISGTP